jgi:hypothetical protein
MKMNDRLHTEAALPSGNETSVSVEQEAGCAPERVLTRDRREGQRREEKNLLFFAD